MNTAKQDLNHNPRNTQDAIAFMKKYDNEPYTTKIKRHRAIDNYTLNSNFTYEEIEGIIKSLKNNKSPGIDGIQAEMIKHCSGSLITDIVNIFNYAIESREFPDIWAEGVRSPIFKCGDRIDANNYRGITVLPVFEKIFETAVQKRIEYINDAFERADRHNGALPKVTELAIMYLYFKV